MDSAVNRCLEAMNAVGSAVNASSNPTLKDAVNPYLNPSGVKLVVNLDVNPVNPAVKPAVNSYMNPASNPSEDLAVNPCGHLAVNPSENPPSVSTGVSSSVNASMNLLWVPL